MRKNMTAEMFKDGIRIGVKQRTDKTYNPFTFTAKDIVGEIKDGHNLIPIVRMNDKMHLANVVFAQIDKFTVTNPFTGLAMRYGFGERYMIKVDNLYDELPEDVKQFIIQHEMGHIKNDHFKEYKTMDPVDLKLRCGRAFDMEVEADKYAASVLGTEAVIDGLLYLRYHYSLGMKCNYEITCRIRHLEEDKESL